MANDCSLLLTFLNILADELQIEEFTSIDETPNLVPILLELIKSGELSFVCNQSDTKFSKAIEYIKNTLGNNIFEELDAKSADKGDKLEIKKMLLALIYALRILQEQKFSQLSDRLGVADNHRMADIISILDSYDRFSPLPFSEVLNSAPFSTPLAHPSLTPKCSESNKENTFSSSTSSTVSRTSLTPKSSAENNKENTLAIVHLNQQSPPKKKASNIQSTGMLASSSKNQSSHRLKTPSTMIKERNYLLALDGSPVNRVLNSPRGEEVIRIHALKDELKSLKDFLDQVGQEKDRLDEQCQTKDAEIKFLKENSERKGSKIARLLVQNERLSSMEEDLLKLEEEKTKFEKIAIEEQNKSSSLKARLSSVKFERDEAMRKLELKIAVFEHLKGEYNKMQEREKIMVDILDETRKKLTEYEQEKGNMAAQLREMKSAIEEERQASRLRVVHKEEQMQDQLTMVQQIKEHYEEQVDKIKRECETEKEKLRQENQQLRDVLMANHVNVKREAYSPSTTSMNAPKSLCDDGTISFSDSMVERPYKSTTQLDLVGKPLRNQLQLYELRRSDRKPRNDDLFDMIDEMSAKRIDDQRVEFDPSLLQSVNNNDFANSSTSSSSNNRAPKHRFGTLKRGTKKTVSNMKLTMSSGSKKIRHLLKRQDSKGRFLEGKDETATIESGTTSDHDISVDSSAKNSNTSRVTK